MTDLMDYKNAQIEALQRKVAELREYNTQLETWVFELADVDCPQEYRDTVRKEVTYTNNI